MLTINGQVDRPLTLSFAELAAIDPAAQCDVSQFDSRRKGTAVTLTALLQLAVARPAADYISLHSESDDFHASIPLSAIRDRAMLIYAKDGQPLPKEQGGPLRFLIRDSVACKTAEIDECANVKFVDRIELTIGRGHDNRPKDETSHAELHEKEKR